MRAYGRYCPIARSSELLSKRWTMIILRNILVGCQLSKRLRELERAGIIEVRPKPDGHGLTYEPTQAGRELSELKHEHAHPGVVLWVWANFFLDRDRLPPGRVVVRFEYPTLAGSARRGWLLTERGDAEYCLKHPGAEEQLIVVVNDPLAFARWHMGQIQWRDALRSGAIEVQGPPALARALPTWNRHGWAAEDPRAGYDGSTQHRPAPTLAATPT